MKFKILAAFLFAGSLFARDTLLTPYSLKAGAFLGTNLHSGAFTALPGVPGKMPDYGSGFGLGLSGEFGVEYNSPKKLFDRNFKFFASVGVSQLSAKFDKDQWVGNWITDDNSEKILVNTAFTPGILTGDLRFGVGWQPFESLPAFLRLGGALSLPLSKNYDKSDEILSPAGVLFLDNSTKIAYSGQIANFAPILAFVNLGADWEAGRVGDFRIVPQADFNLGLNSIVENTDWKESTVRIGVAAVYDIEKSKPAPAGARPGPPPPPPPPPPLPTLAYRISLANEGTELRPGDTVYFIKEIYESYRERNFPLIAFYSKGVAELTPYDGINPGEEILTEAKELFSKGKYDLQIFIGYGVDETPEIAQLRKVNIENLLGIKEQAQLSDRKTSIEIVPPSKKAKKHEALAEESRFIKFVFNSGAVGKEIVLTGGTEKLVPKRFDVSTGIDGAAGAASSTVEVKVNGNVKLFVRAARDTTAEFTVDDASSPGSEILAQGEVKDSAGRTARAGTEYHIAFKRKVVSTTVNYDNSSKSREFVLGYFDFDESVFSSIDREALETIRQAFAEGKRFEILAGTDSIGSEDHNAKLAKKRGETALRLIGAEESAGIKIIIEDPDLFSNDTPYKRVRNRSVKARIYD